MLKCSIAFTCRMMLFILTHNACELNESKKLSTADDAKNLLYQFSFNASQSMCVESECTAGCPELKNTSFRSTAAHRMELGRTIVDILVSACCCCWTDEWVQFDDLTVSVYVCVWRLSKWPPSTVNTTGRPRFLFVSVCHPDPPSLIGSFQMHNAQQREMIMRQRQPDNNKLLKILGENECSSDSQEPHKKFSAKMSTLFCVATTGDICKWQTARKGNVTIFTHFFYSCN